MMGFLMVVMAGVAMLMGVVTVVLQLFRRSTTQRNRPNADTLGLYQSDRDA